MRAKQLAERVMKEVEKGHRAAAETQRQERILRELEWARVRRDVLLTRHPTNWAGASLLQVHTIIGAGCSAP